MLKTLWIQTTKTKGNGYICSTLFTNYLINFMKKSVAVLMLSLLTVSLVTMSCGNKKKTSCAAYDKAEIQVVDQESDLANN
jgi:hypothetical protein